MLRRRWCIPLAALAIALAPALAAGGASATVTAVTTATPSPSASALIAAEAAHDAHASQPAADDGQLQFQPCLLGRDRRRQAVLLRAQAARHPPDGASVSPDAIPSGCRLRPLPVAVRLRPDRGLRLRRGRAYRRAGRRVQRPDRRQRPGRLPVGRRAARACPSFKPVNQNGATSPLPATAPASDDWTLEESLDLDMVSAICPLCNIVLVEATNDSGDGLVRRREHRRQPGRQVHLQLLGRHRVLDRHHLRLRVLQPPGRRHHRLRGRLRLRRDLPGDLAERGRGRRHRA